MKRFLKIVLWIVLIAIVIVTLRRFPFWKFSPEKKIIALIENQSASAGMPVRVQSLKWTFPAQLEISRIQVRSAEWQTAESEPFFSLNRLVVKCRILPLLRRRLDIAEIRIDEPKISLDSSFFHFQAKPRQTKPPAPPKHLPFFIRLFSLGLYRFDLDRFDLRMKLPSSQGGTELLLDGLNLAVSGMRLPRKWMESPRGVRGSVRLFTDRANLIVRLSGMEFQWVPDLDVEFNWLKARHWNLNAKAGISNAKRPDQKGIFLNLVMDGIGYGDSIRVRESALHIGSETAIHITGDAFRNRGTLQFHLRAQGQPCDLGILKRTVENLLPDSLAHQLARFDARGRVNLLQGDCRGDITEFQFQIESILKAASLQNNLPPLFVQGGDVTISSSGRWKPSGFENGRISGKGKIDRIAVQVNDSTAFSLQALSADWQVETDRQFMPKVGRLSGGVADVLNGRATFNLEMRSVGSAELRPEDIRIDGDVKADSMDIAALPNIPAGIGGKVNVRIQLKARGPVDIRLSATAGTPGIRYLIQNKPETSPPLAFLANAFMHTQKPFHVWTLDSAIIRSENWLSARLSGNADLNRTAFWFSLDRAVLHNDPLARFLPASLLEQMKGLKLFGEETLMLQIKGNGGGKNPQVRIIGKLIIEKTGMALPEMAIGLEGIHGEVALNGTLDRLEADGLIFIPTIFLNQVRSTPIKDSLIRFHLNANLPDSLTIENGELEIPTLLTSGKFHLGMGQMSKMPRMALSLEAGLKSPNRLEVIRGLSLSGNALCELRMTALDMKKQQFRISGLIQSDSLCVFQQDLVEVQNIACSVPFLVDVDLTEKRLLNPDTKRPMSWVAYEAGREALQHTGAALNNVRIEKVSILDYQISRILLDLRVQNGRIDVPWFSANLLSGNIGGNLWFDPNTGQPRDMKYSIRAQASRINSAQLKGLGVQTGEETELDATLDFEGKGIDPNQALDLEGSFHITQIGPKFASTLLEQMDPKGSDRSIRLTRRLLKAGWKPKLLSFELRHGYVYPSLVLDQPWFSPLRIPDKVEYGRLPLEFFMKQKSMFQMK